MCKTLEVKWNKRKTFLRTNYFVRSFLSHADFGFFVKQDPGLNSVSFGLPTVDRLCCNKARKCKR